MYVFIPPLTPGRHHNSCDTGSALERILYYDHMESHYHYPTPPSFALPNPAPISMTGNHGAAFAPVADMTSLYPPTSYLFPSAFAPHCITEPTNAPVNTPLLTGYSSRAVPDSTNRAG